MDSISSRLSASSFFLSFSSPISGSRRHPGGGGTARRQGKGRGSEGDLGGLSCAFRNIRWIPWEQPCLKQPATVTFREIVIRRNSQLPGNGQILATVSKAPPASRAAWKLTCARHPHTTRTCTPLPQFDSHRRVAVDPRPCTSIDAHPKTGTALHQPEAIAVHHESVLCADYKITQVFDSFLSIPHKVGRNRLL